MCVCMVPVRTGSMCGRQMILVLNGASLWQSSKEDRIHIWINVQAVCVDVCGVGLMQLIVPVLTYIQTIPQN